MDLQTPIDKCPFCEFDFTLPISEGGFGKPTSLSEARQFVESFYQPTGPIAMPAHNHCPCCFFGYTPERAKLVLHKTITRR